MGLSIWQILIIVLVIVLLFGSRKIPALMRDVGSGMNAFKRGLKTDSDEKDEAEEVEEVSPAVENKKQASAKKGSSQRSGSRKSSTANS